MMRLGFGLGFGLITAAMSLTACEQNIDLDPVDTRTVVEPSVRPPAITGGTLTITGDRMAVAADPDRDRVYLVDIAFKSLRHTVELSPGDQPFRVAEGAQGRVHVVLRGSGSLATIDTETGTVLARTSLCPDPRGLAYEADAAALHVACADGTLLHLDEATGAEQGRAWLEPDLRDVVMIDDRVWVSRFRDASLTGEHGGRLIIGDHGDSEPGVAYRTIVDNNGHVMMLHQLSSRDPVPTELDPEDVGDDDDGGGGSPYGGGGGFCQPSISSPAFTHFTEEGTLTTPLTQSHLAVDAAVSPNGQWLALATPGAAEGEPTVAIMPPSAPGCHSQEGNGRTEEQITAVAFDGQGTLVMQSREPARLLIQSELPRGEVFTIDLPGPSVYDTGHEIFHRVTDSGLSCASCHPEGTDDGHVWIFADMGPRRTQSLEVGLADSAPYHWEGDMTDLDTLMEEVLSHRMGGKRQSPERRESFTQWLFAQHRPPADAGLDEPTLVEAGADLFVSLDCVRCHTGGELGGTLTTPVRDVDLQVPSLHRVSLRPPFMHDGRSPTLEAAVQDMIESTTTAPVTSADVEALSAYMRTL